MAETKNQEEPTFYTKRKPDLNSEGDEEHPKKAQKLQTLENNSSAPLDKNEECEATTKSNSNLEVPNSECSSVTDGRIEKDESNEVAKEGGNEDGEEDNDVDDDDEDDVGDEEEDEDEDDEESDGKAEVDIKGKGKLIEEDDEDDDDSDDDDDGGSSDDGDLSDDPLAEVDLNNILPSRTRRRNIHPGVYFTDDLKNEEDDDDSDA